MQHPIIRLAYRHHIDATATTPFDQKIFNATASPASPTPSATISS